MDGKITKTEVKKKKTQEFNLKTKLIAAIRRLWRCSDTYHNVKNSAKIDVTVSYQKGDNLVTIIPDKKYGISPFSVSVYKNVRNGKRIMFRCAICKRLFFDHMFLKTKKGKLKKCSMIAVDHIEPVVPTDRADWGWDWNEYIARMFCGPDNLQVICNYIGQLDGRISCHANKTQQERMKRKENVQKNNKERKKT